MKKYEDFIEGLQQEVQVPEKVWAQYMDTLEHIDTRAEERRGGNSMDRKKKTAGKTWGKAAAAAAGILMTGTLIFGCVDPVAASELPIIGKIFDRVAEDATYSGDYTEKTVLQDVAQTSGTEEEAVCAASDNGITLTASEVYSDGYSVYLAVEVKVAEGGLSGIPFHYTRRFEEKQSQMIQVDGTWRTKEEETTRLSNSGFEGQAVDDHTFIGMMKLDRDRYSEEEDILSLHLSEIRYADAEEAEHRIAGDWSLTIPFSANTESCREMMVNQTGPDGFAIQKVFVSPYQVIVFTDTPYTTLSPDTYTREDFEAQWGEKNQEILAGGDPAVTYEEMLAKKQYQYYELAVYGPDGEALETMYGDPFKTVFAVQGKELSKLHIYAADGSDEYGFARAASEQEAREQSVLEAEVDL